MSPQCEGYSIRREDDFPVKAFHNRHSAKVDGVISVQLAYNVLQSRDIFDALQNSPRCGRDSKITREPILQVQLI
jgi:hypothetical protein